MPRKDNRGSRAAYQRELRERRRQAGLCLKCGSVPPREGKTTCARCQETSTRAHLAWWRRQPEGTQRRYHVIYRDKLRREVIDAYGGACACCGETELGFLTVDHPNNDGAAHRLALVGVRRAGNHFYQKLRMAGFPPGLRVLCWNCNCARATLGVCPHELARGQDTASKA